jgi:hypothetical protein
MLRLARPKLREQRSRRTLHEDIRKLGCRQHVHHVDITDDHVFPHKVEVDLNMFRTLLLNGVSGEVDGADVVTVDKGAIR